MKLPLKHSLIGAFLLLQTVTVSAILFSSYVTSQHVLLGHMCQLMEKVASETIDHVRDFLDPVETAADLTQRLARHKVVGTENLGAMERYLFETLQLHPRFAGIYYGSMDGAFYFVKREDGDGAARYRTKLITTGESGRRVELIWRDAEFQPVRQALDPDDPYDPRTRPWFKKALAREQLIWTDPYIFFTSQNPGITTASPVRGPDGKIIGVVGVDIEIADISSFLSQLSISANGSAFILNGNGDVIAHPDSGKIVQAKEEGTAGLRFTRIDELSDPISRAAFLSLHQPAGKAELERTLFTRFELDGEAHHAIFVPFPGPDWPWLIGIHVPEDDFLGAIKENQLQNIWLAVAIGALACAVGLFLALNITRPMEALQRNAAAIRRGRFPAHVGIRSALREIQETADAFHRMVVGLRERDQHNRLLNDNIRRARDELEQRVEQRTQELKAEIADRRRAEERAAAANYAKSQFLANMSHELRTPLNAILGFSEIMRRQLYGPLGDRRYVSYATDVHEAGGYLLKLINDVLDLSQIEADKLALEESPCVVADVVTGALRLVEQRAERKQLCVTTDYQPMLPPLLADELRLRQILLNLLSNAVKFTPEGGRIGIAASLSETGGLEIGISDDGIGMTAEELATAMTLFGQARNRQLPRSEGTGLGLNLAKRLAEAHGGRLTLESEPGIGTTARLWLPPERLLPRQPAQPPERLAAAQQD